MLVIGALLAAAAVAQLPQPGYRADWVAVAQPAVSDMRIPEGKWQSAIRFRPAKIFVLDADVTPVGKNKPALAAGTVMIGMTTHARVACELDRPRGDYFVGCVEDRDGDGRSETFFELNHANPFLFSALRQPRHKDKAIAPVTLTARLSSGDENGVEMVLFYRNRAELVGKNVFELCVLRADNRNMWGDKTQARGCLPPITIADSEFPRKMTAYGRVIEFKSRDEAGALVAVSGADADLPVLL
jgi:hypothetical protein